MVDLLDGTLAPHKMKTIKHILKMMTGTLIMMQFAWLLLQPIGMGDIGDLGHERPVIEVTEQDSVIVDYTLSGGDFSTHHYSVIWWYEREEMRPLTSAEVTKMNRKIMAILKEEAKELSHKPSKEDIANGVRWARLMAMQITEPVMLEEIQIQYVEVE